MLHQDRNTHFKYVQYTLLMGLREKLGKL